MSKQIRTSPGIHPNFPLNIFTVRERNILRKLRSWWYLTSGRRISLGRNSEVPFCLLKPIDSFAEMFNLDREVICLFSSFRAFEPRTLEAYEKARDCYRTPRTETVCRVLVSEDSQVESLIRKLIKNDPEQPVVVPFTYDELLKCDSLQFIKDRFSQYFFTRDLFAFLSPLRNDLYFFGRSELVQDQISRHKSGEHSSLFGLRKSGKTSIIYAIERAMSFTKEKVILFDCESPSIHQLSWNELLKLVIKKYADELIVKLSKRDLENYKFDAKEAANSFEQLMLKIHGSRNSPRTLFIFDEIERISPSSASSAHWRDGLDFVYFWQALRSVFQKHPNIFTYMLVGTNPSCVEKSMLNGHENPLFQSIPSTYIPAFTAKQVKEMVERLGRYMGLQFDDTILYKLHEDFGGHPFLIRQFCSQLHKSINLKRPYTVGKPRYESVKKEFDLSINQYLEMIINVLKEWYRDEYDILTYLAVEDYDSFDEFAYEHPQYTQHLIEYQILQKDDSGFSFRMESVKRYLRQTEKYQKLNLTMEEKWSEISERRNRVERKLRKYIRQVFIITLGKEEGREKILNKIPAERREKLQKEGFDILLSSNNSPLYFLDLKNIIIKNWASFANIFGQEKDKIDLALTEINRFRADAHAKGITNEEIDELRYYLDRIEKHLSDNELE